MDALVTSIFETTKYILIRQIRVNDIVLQGLLTTLIGAILIFIRTDWHRIRYYFCPITSAQFNDTLHKALSAKDPRIETYGNGEAYYHKLIYHLRQTVYPPDSTVTMIYRAGYKIVYTNENNEAFFPVGGYMVSYPIMLYYNGRDFVSVIITDVDKITMYGTSRAVIVRYLENLSWPSNSREPPKIEGKIRLYGKDGQQFVYIDEQRDLNTWVFRYRTRVLTALQNMNNPAYLNGYGPKNLGILLHGPPGTGKTSFVRVLARHTGRDIVPINLRTINTITAFEKLYDKFAVHKVIFYIDEADFVLCGGDNNILTQQKELKQQRMLALTSKAGKESIDLIKKELERIDKELEDLNDLFTVDWLLQFLDGIQTCTNRIIVLATNNPDKIYPPLLRPGRIDLNLHLDRFNHDEVVDLLTQIYPDSKIRFPGRLDGQYAPADIINIASQCNSAEETVQRLWQGREKQD